MTEPQVQHRPWNLSPALREWGPLGQLPFIQGAQVTSYLPEELVLCCQVQGASHRLLPQHAGGRSLQAGFGRDLFLFGWTFSLNKGPGVQLWPAYCFPFATAQIRQGMGAEVLQKGKGTIWPPHLAISV